jgi:type IV secretion system protein TrbL
MAQRVMRSRILWRLALMIVIIAVEVLPVFGQQPKPSQIMDQYRAQRVTWTTNIWPYANTLFGILATIEFAWSAAVMLLERSDLQSWTSALVRKMMWIGAFYALLLNGRTWIPAIIDSFEQIGQTSSGFSSIAPSDVFAQGIDIAGALMDSASTSAFFTNTGVCLSLVVAAALIVLAFTGICIQFIVAMVESYTVVAAGFIFLGFGGSRWTAPYTERYIGLAVSTGLKIMLLYLLIGTGMNISVTWMTDAQQVSTSTHPAMGAFEIMGAALIFLMLCWQIPKLFSAVLGGAPALTGGDLLGTGMGVVAGATAVGSLAAGGVALAARGAAAISGVGAAAGAGGSGAGTSAAGIGAAGRGSGGGGGAGRGFVPPPPSRPSGNGVPKHPNPPSGNGGSGGASADVAGVGSSANGGSPPTRNGTSRHHSSNGNVATSSSLASALSSVGGDHLTGSGFESERSAGGFTPASVPIHSTASIRSSIGNDAAISGADSASSVPPPPRTAGGASPSPGLNPRAAESDRPGTPGESVQSGTGSAPGVVSDVRSVGSTPAPSQQPPPGSRRERIGSAARRTDAVLSRAARRLRGVRNQFGGLPSDAAPHTPPPRMPVEHHD